MAAPGSSIERNPADLVDSADAKNLDLDLRGRIDAHARPGRKGRPAGPRFGALRLHEHERYDRRSATRVSLELLATCSMSSLVVIILELIS
jgi:hypothetical protein